MCLSRIIRSNMKRGRFPEEIVGYKVLKVIFGKLTSQYAHVSRVHYRRRRWYHDATYGYIIDITGIQYKRGYHMYTNKKDAIREANRAYTHEVVAKVRLQEIHTYGKQSYRDIGFIYVGKKMMITEIVHTNKRGVMIGGR